MVNVPYDSGIVICKEPKSSECSSLNARYLPETSEPDPILILRNVKTARAIECWAAFTHWGEKGVIDLVSAAVLRVNVCGQFERCGFTY